MIMSPIKKSLSQPILYSSVLTSSSSSPLTTSPPSTTKQRLLDITNNSHSLCTAFLTITETMRRRGPTTLFFVFLTLLIFAFFSLFVSRTALLDTADMRSALPPNLTTNTAATTAGIESRRQQHTRHHHHHRLPPEVVVSKAVREEVSHHTRHVASIQDFSSSSSSTGATKTTIDSVSVLLPGWEVLVIVSQETMPFLNRGENYTCLYPNNDMSEARFAGVMPSTNQTTFKCDLPNRLRRRQPFPSPVLTKFSTTGSPPPDTAAAAASTELLRWSNLVYESYSTENDVVLFVKGVNNRQGVNRLPQEFMCVFSYSNSSHNINHVKTAVTSSIQEVFRCHHPKIPAVNDLHPPPIKVSLEITRENRVVPSVAYYAPPASQKRKIDNNNEHPRQHKSLICACTMVYNVAKFLREWVMYHSKIGVDKFILYDNESDDDLASVVKALNQEGYNIETLFWIWPKTQEAGFSHGAVYAKESCTWMMYVDVDEFVFSPTWLNASSPSNHMIKSLLPKTPQHKSSNHKQVGQVSIKCNDFGPSNQVSHPVEGVTQGYNCRRKIEQRHKSIVLLDAVDHSLLNVVHHFELNQKYYRWKDLGVEAAVVNHYKYQAWSEFKTKFRRRVSAYVVDWQSGVNPKSKDRTPGLGFQAIEPKGWPQKFCEVHDERLKLLTRKWFRLQTPTGYKMAWQR